MMLSEAFKEHGILIKTPPTCSAITYWREGDSEDLMVLIHLCGAETKPGNYY